MTWSHPITNNILEITDQSIILLYPFGESVTTGMIISSNEIPPC